MRERERGRTKSCARLHTKRLRSRAENRKDEINEKKHKGGVRGSGVGNKKMRDDVFVDESVIEKQEGEGWVVGRETEEG